MRMNLDDLEAKAKAAMGYKSTAPVAVAFGWAKEFESLYQIDLVDAANPQTVLALIHIAKTVRKLVDSSSRWRKSFDLELPEQWLIWMDDLENALKALEGGD